MIADIKTVAWRSDPDAETILSLIGSTCCIEDVSFSDIDDAASANNCARMGNPINEEKVEEYEASMRRGDVFPRMVFEKGKKGFVVLGGNQRYAAAKRYGVKQCSAYVVTPLTENHRQAVIRSLNSRHGWGTDKTERIDHAVYLVRVCGFLQDDAAKLMSVSTGGISMRLRAEDTRQQLGASGLNANKLNMTALYAIGRIKDEDTQKQIAKTAIASDATSESIAAVASQIESAKGKARKSEIVKEWAKELAYKSKSNDSIATVVKTPRRDKFMRRLNDMVNFLDRGNDGSGYSTMDELQCSEIVDGDVIRLQAAKIIMRLKLISGV